MGFKLAFHPDWPRFGPPDLDQFESAIIARADERIIAETGFDPLAPRDVLISSKRAMIGYRRWGIEAEGLPPGEKGRVQFVFEVVRA